MIADSLPDAFGNSLIDAWMATQGISPSQITPLDRLAYLGKRGMGALEFLPDIGPTDPRPTAIDLSELVLAARAAVHGSVMDDQQAEEALYEIINVGTSAGGARAKAIINFNPETLEVQSGHLPASPGFQPWLLKFDGIGKDLQLGNTEIYGRIEYAYSLMAKAAGIDVPPTRLLEENGRAHFMTRRFDRDDQGHKVHMQSLCAMNAVDFNLRGTNEYAQYFQCIEALNLGDDAKTEAFRRLVFNIIAMNRDDHSKNFAFLLDENQGWRLAPAYDVTFAYNPEGRWTRQHLMAVDGKFSEIRHTDLLVFADRHQIPRAKSTIEAVQQAVNSWSEYATLAGISPTQAETLGAFFQTLT
jgi:serine/threonine-protein kinase HipA